MDFRYQKDAVQSKKDSGFIMATLLSFLPLIFILGTVVTVIGLQSYRSSVEQQYKQQAQLASTSAIEYAKEQYELDITYTGTPETTLYINDLSTVTYEVVHRGFSNAINTQQDISGIGRVYRTGESTPTYTREVQSKITYTSGSPSSVRFIFIVDNSGSMSISEWQQSKNTIDASISYILSSVSTAEVAVVQYGSHNSLENNEHKYDVTVPFTNDLATATTWNRRYGPGSISYNDLQDHLPASLARMRLESVYGPGDLLDLSGATEIQYILFTDAWGTGFGSTCCSSLKKLPSEPINWHNDNGPLFSILDGYGEYNALKDGSVFAGDGYPGLSAQFTVLSINPDTQTRAISAALASPGGSWKGAVELNPGDPEGSGIIPRRFISTTLSAGPTEILSLIKEIIEEEINI